MSDGNNIVVSLSNHKTFFAIATRNLSEIRLLVNERDSRTKGHEIADNDVDFICVKNALIERCAMITIVFSAMTVESYINQYGIERSSCNYFRNYLDKPDLKSKWVLFPRLFAGKQLDTGSGSLQLLGELIVLRNRLVHDRTRKKRISELNDSDWVGELQAKQAVDTVRELLGDLAKLDADVDLEWLNEVESDPFA